MALGQCQVRVNLVLSQCWVCVGSVLGQSQVSVRSVLSQGQVCFRSVLGSYQVSDKLVLSQNQVSVRSVLGQTQGSVRFVLGQCWICVVCSISNCTYLLLQRNAAQITCKPILNALCQILVENDQAVLRTTTGLRRNIFNCFTMMVQTLHSAPLELVRILLLLLFLYISMGSQTACEVLPQD